MPLPAAIPPDWQRRSLAAALALGINAALLAAILLGRVGTVDRPVEALHVTLVELPLDVEPQAEPIPEPETIQSPAEAPQPRSEPEEARPAADPSAPVSARSVDTAPETVPSGERDIYAVSPGTRSVLSGMQCPGDPEGFARTGVCPDHARRGLTVAAQAETAEDHYSIDVWALRAEWGIGPGILAGEPTLDNPQERRTLSSSDQMRDMLPASRPDPVFGD